MRLLPPSGHVPNVAVVSVAMLFALLAALGPSISPAVWPARELSALSVTR